VTLLRIRPIGGVVCGVDPRRRLRSYFRYRRHQADPKEWHGMLDLLSPSLRAEVGRGSL
jgi:hypothetical protein